MIPEGTICQKQLILLNEPYPRSCPTCGLGKPCKYSDEVELLDLKGRVDRLEQSLMDADHALREGLRRRSKA